MAHEKTYLTWLNNAHGMEHSLIQVLENHAKDAKEHPQVQARIEAHLEETRRHAELIKGCIERRGGNVSSLKSGLGKVMGTLQGMSTEFFKDELIKNALADYASENFEIASYTSLIAAAEELGDFETAEVCKQVLEEEKAMAQFLAEQIPTLTRQYLAQQAAEH